MFYGYSAYTSHNVILKLFLLVLIAFLFDLYFHRGIKELFKNIKRKSLIHTLIRVNWLFFLLYVASSLFYLMFFKKDCDDPFRVSYIMWINSFFILSYIPKSVFNILHLLRDILRLIRISIEKIIKRRVISMVLIRKYFLKAGLIISFLTFLIIIYGIGFGKQHYKVKHVEISLANLPDTFDGYKIVQISDIHFGSSGKSAKFNKAVEMINALDADLVVFTGDMVNFKASEAEPWISEFNKIKATDGKYAVFGNHDFGDYIECYTEKDKSANLIRLKNIQQQMGFYNLMNESLCLKRSQDSIALVGVMNTTQEPYKSYGKLDEALSNCSDVQFKILLSHDPHHWELEVKDNYAIDLTLSGHTHGAQFGIDLPFYHWCPLDWMYKYWGGVYEENARYLYVNQGLGVIGFQGRIGIRPEITLITLHNKHLPQ